MKIRKHHRGLAGTFIAASMLYYFAFTAKDSSAVMLNCSTAGSINVPVIECQGLVELFNNTAGASWTNSTNWNTNTNVCTWYGIGCTNIAGQDHVTRVTLPSNNIIGGPLPNSMSGLRYITGLNLANNSLQGTLPLTWSTWTGIQQFNISFNNLSGALPSTWSTWTGIKSFHAGYNKFTSLPTSWTGWKEIQSFVMPFNLLTGTLPSEWGGWSSIMYIDLNSNFLKGTLPASWSGWTNMSAFYMMDNEITGPLPTSWSTWTKMDVFYMYRNKLQGSLPASWSGWTKIREFTIHHNEVTGSLPTSWSTWTGVENVNISSNQLTGTLPSTWSTWKKIGYLSLAGNGLVGTLPASWSARTGITQMDLRQNYLTGNVPASRTNMTSIVSGGLMINYNCLNTLLPEPPAAFVDAQAEADWKLTQYRCVISDLAINKSSTNVNATIGGGLVTYIISYVNSGAMAVSGVMIYDDMPLGLNFISASPAPTTVIGGSLSWDIGELLSMQTGYIILTGQVDTNWDGVPFMSGDTITNMATIYGRVHQLSGDELNDSSISNPVTVIDPSIYSDLRVVKINGNTTGLIGSTFTYVINYINSGSTSVSGISVYDSLQSGFSFISASPAPTSVSGSDLVWDIGTLTAMQSGRIFLTGYISESFVSGDVISNTVNIDGNLSDIDNNNNLSTTLPVTLFDVDIPSDLVITKTVSGSATAHIGNFITYIINYINSGASTITGVVIHDLLMTGLSLPDYDGAVPAPIMITGFRDISWDIGTLTPMQSGSIVMYIYVGGPFASGTIVPNTATIDGYLSDVNPANNSSTTNINVMLATGDISITKSTTGTTITAGSILSYDIYYRTENNSIPEPIIISDILPAGLTYVTTDFSDNPLNIDYTTGITVTGSSITWQLWALTPNATGSFKVYVQVDASVVSGTILTNTASISGDLQDINRTNNTSTSSPVRVFAPLITGDLAIFKSASVLTGVIPGQPITFTLTYMNSGANTITGVYVQDQMQAGLTYVSSNYTSGLTIAANTVLESMGTFPIGSWSYSGTLLSWHLPAGIPANTSRTILVQAIVNDEIYSGGGFAMNVATITGSIYQDVSMINNASFLYIEALTGNSATGGSLSTGSTTGNNPTNPDPRGYAGGGFGSNPIPNIVSLGSAPTLLDDEVCIYKDGDFERYKTTFKDIQNSIFKPAVDLMLDYCLVQGEYNGGKMFGVYNYLRWGEAYKVFSRLAGLSFSRTANPAHWSDRYRFAGQKVNLWASTTSQPHDPRSYIRYADIYTIGNNILKYYNKPLLDYDPSMNYNNAISRGKFALFMQNIINTIKQ